MMKINGWRDPIRTAKVRRLAVWLTISALVVNLGHVYGDSIWRGIRRGGKARLYSTNNLKASPQGFAERCKGDGVIVCEGFDSADSVHAAAYPGTGLYPA